MQKRRVLMTETDKEKLIREYAAGEVTWSALRRRGFYNYRDVLTELGKLGLRPPSRRWTGRMRGAPARALSFAASAQRREAVTEGFGLIVTDATARDADDS
jgi:hypothetical protein